MKYFSESLVYESVERYHETHISIKAKGPTHTQRSNDFDVGNLLIS